MKKSVHDKFCERLSNLNSAELCNFLQHLDKERNLLNSIFNLLQESILLVDYRGNIEFHNKAAVRLLNLPRDYKKIAPLWHWIPILKTFFTSGNAIHPDVFSKETELIYPEKKWIRIHVQHFHEKDHKKKGPPRFIVLLQDITKETQDYEERFVQERFDSIVQLSSEVAHELGNPLNSVGIHLQLIQRALKSSAVPAKVQQSLSVCQDEIQRLNEIIQHFLQAVRPREVVLNRGSVVPVLKKVLSILKPQLNNLNIDVQLNVIRHLSHVFIDPSRLHQAFFNVLKNAIEAIGSRGWIRISCLQDDCNLIVAFADSGGGIPGEQVLNMLSDSNQSKKQQGHGIGMLIVRRIMREHHGWVEIESKKDLGSILYLKFPLPEQSLRKLSTNA